VPRIDAAAAATGISWSAPAGPCEAKLMEEGGARRRWWWLKRDQKWQIRRGKIASSRLAVFGAERRETANVLLAINQMISMQCKLIIY
jgi:hypothetical protein